MNLRNTRRVVSRRKRRSLPIILSVTLAVANLATTTIAGQPILIDQFGYRPAMKKVAVIRDPVIGYDAEDSFEPGSTYRVVRVDDGTTAYTGAPVVAANGEVGADCGDRAWWFDFSDVTDPGTYVVEDVDRGVRSDQFRIGDDVYEEVLKHAFRTFFYQRAGFAKRPPAADPRWADDASHLGPGQDAEARRFDARDDPSTTRDLRGGWYDAGDYNKYTSWHARYVIGLLHCYLENPAAWGDDFGIPESGNGTSDLLDEVLFGVRYLQRLQNEDGSMLSIVDLSEDSPPSSATGPSLYGPPNTSGTLTSAAALAIAGKVFADAGYPGVDTNDWIERAERAFAWAEANPRVIFKNNSPEYDSEGIGAGQQEVDDRGRRWKRAEAAIHLAAATGKPQYHAIAQETIIDFTLLKDRSINPWQTEWIRDLFFYASLPEAPRSLAGEVETVFADAMNAADYWPKLDAGIDPYRAPMKVYTWGSNGVKSAHGMLYGELVRHDIGNRPVADAKAAAAGYLHYLHGVNPLTLVYLSNMNEYGAERSADTFYHAWYHDKSDIWDSVRDSKFGPAPGFLTGGPNPSYTWDPCCPDGCGDGRVDCGEAMPSPPTGQPPQKSYLEFNDSWPLNSWSVTENSNSYQTLYLRLLSKFVGPDAW